MQVRQNQMLGMIGGSDTFLLAAIKALVRNEHSYVVEGLPDDVFDELIRRGIETARGFDLAAPHALATFVLLMFEFGPEFYRHAAIQRVLSDATHAPEQRLKRVIEATPSEVWEAIQAALHRQTWFPELRQTA